MAEYEALFRLRWMVYAHLCVGGRINGPVGGMKKAPHDAELSVQSTELSANLGDD